MGAPAGATIDAVSGAWAWTPGEADGPGSYTFDVCVSDGVVSDCETVTVTVNEVNAAPVAADDSYSTVEDTVLTVAVPGVLGNDTDVDGDALTAVRVDAPAHGTLTLNPDGSFIYEPAANYSGGDSFTYQANDGHADSNVATVSLVVTRAIPQPTGLTCTDLQPKAWTTPAGEKPQFEVWQHDGTWWSVFPTTASGATSAGTWLWKLVGTAWTEALNLSGSTDLKADVEVAGNVVHVLLNAGTSTQLVSLEYSGATYQPWSARLTPSPISLPNSEIATIEIDSTGRMWLATENDANTQIVAYYSDSPYATWNGPVTVATGVNDDDSAVVTALPGKIAILWSNHNTQRFGFRVHTDGTDPATWADDEVPASQSALNIGLGMADDPMNLAVASDGTLYAAVMTSYDTAGYPKIALLVRRPAGTWDDLHEVDQAGTWPIVLLDEVHGYLTVVYTSSESSYGPMVYKQSTTGPIAFGDQTTLRERLVQRCFGHEAELHR